MTPEQLLQGAKLSDADRREAERRLRNARSVGGTWPEACEQVFEDWVHPTRGYEGPPAWTLYAVAATLAPEGHERELCLAEACFMTASETSRVLRLGEARQVAGRLEEARSRTAKAKAAGSKNPRKFSDEDLLKAYQRVLDQSGKPVHGYRKLLAAKLRVRSDDTITRRLKALNLPT